MPVFHYKNHQISKLSHSLAIYHHNVHIQRIGLKYTLYALNRSIDTCHPYVTISDVIINKWPLGLGTLCSNIELLCYAPMLQESHYYAS